MFFGSRRMGKNVHKIICAHPMKLSAIAGAFLFFAGICVSPHYAQAEKINKLLEIKQKLKKALNSISDSRAEEKSLRSNIENLNETISRKEKELHSYDRKMSRTQSDISRLSQEIDLLMGNMDGRKQNLKEYITFLYKQQYGNDGLALVSAMDYQDLARKSKYINLIANFEGRVIEKYVRDIQEINSRRRDMEMLLEELEDSKQDAQDRKKALQTDLSKKDEILSRVRDKQAAYEKKVKELEESSQKLEGFVTTGDRKKIPEAILGSGFGSLKGHLTWPVHGKVLIPFGQHKDAVYNISTMKNGMEIEAGTEDVPKAVAGGRVIYAGTFEGYGTLIIIDHGNGYNTVYGNLSDVQLKKGELLIQGMDLGKITNSKFLNTPTLYFEIRYNGKPLDPMNWLEKNG
ncbi:MAG: hypothetical protein C4538_02150 [Nitrospiraceae bacterium]|nr:MAG: hypothetical protein C4538_02150 [Nitrospiraceae bacterium]